MEWGPWWWDELGEGGGGLIQGARVCCADRM